MAMMIHLPVLENRANQFAARFEPLGDGNFAWFRNDWSSGLLVYAAERESLIAAHMAALARVQRIMRWWLPGALAGIILAVVLSGGQISNWWGGVIAAAPMPWMALELWRAERLPLSVTRGRMAVLPPRGLIEGGASRLAALPPTISWLMIGVGALLLFRLWQEHQLASDKGGVLLGLGVMVFGAAIAVLRRRRLA